MNRKDLVENAKYIVIGMVAAYLLNLTLGVLLGTGLPIVAVVSESMTHDDTTENNHYQFLIQNYGYTREEIDSWPIRNGFLKGDVLIVKGADTDQLEVGDVIVFDTPTDPYPIVHRIIQIGGQSILTKGDHNGVVDDKTITKIHGKVVFIIPLLGWPKLILTDILSAVL